MPNDSGGIISSDELNQLVDLFPQFEGASNPFAAPCREAEYQFNVLIERLYVEKVVPNFPSVTRSLFRSHVRNICRSRVSKQGPRYPCV